MKICTDEKGVVKYSAQKMAYTSAGLRVGNIVDPKLNTGNSKIHSVSLIPDGLSGNSHTYEDGKFSMTAYGKLKTDKSKEVDETDESQTIQEIKDFIVAKFPEDPLLPKGLATIAAIKKGKEA